MAKIKQIKIEELIPDDKNHNIHTKKGMDLLEKSLGKVGIIESITVSNDNKIISGNARHEIIGRNFNEEAILIETDGTKPVIIKRTDIISETKQFYEASILANTTAKANIEIDVEAIELLVEEFQIDAEELSISNYIDNAERNRSIIGNSYYAEKEIFKDDFMYLELSKFQIRKLEDIREKLELEHNKEVIYHLIENYDN